jgi:hypothetical protein
MVSNEAAFYWARTGDVFIDLRMREQRPQSASSDRIWQAQLLRQQQAVRDQGRIGYIGYEGPSSS